MLKVLQSLTSKGLLRLSVLSPAVPKIRLSPAHLTSTSCGETSIGSSGACSEVARSHLAVGAEVFSLI